MVDGLNGETGTLALRPVMAEHKVVLGHVIILSLNMEVRIVILMDRARPKQEHAPNKIVQVNIKMIRII